METTPGTSGQTIAQPAREPSRITVPGNRGVKVVRSCTIRRPAADLYQFWRSLENLVQVIKHPVTITRISDTESHWVVSAPGDKSVEWDAAIINDEPNELIAWRSKEGADIANAGTVRFEPAPGDEGTEVRVQLEYDAPGGKFAALLAKLTGEEPEQQVAETLRRFKALMESGEIPTTEGQSAGGAQAKKRREERLQRQRRIAS
jgi:Predicted integral membrane protein